MISIPFSGELDLERTLLGGQSFRWKAEGDGFRGIAFGKSVHAELRGQELLIDGDDDAERWADYFALDADYAALLDRFREDPVLGECVSFAPGIRVLRQDFFEALICFITSACNNIPRITGIIGRLCEAFGEPIPGGYAFPTPKRLAAADLSEYEPLRAGYRAKYIRETADIIRREGWDAEVLRALPYQDARKKLCGLPGVGGKVADCVLLFSLGFREAFPRDVHILHAMERLFPGGLPECCRGAEGIAQQYIFEYARCQGTALRCPCGSADNSDEIIRKSRKNRVGAGSDC